MSTFRNRFLTPLKRDIRKFNIFSFDVETYGRKNKFLMVSIYGNVNEKEFKKTFFKKEDFINFLIANIQTENKVNQENFSIFNKRTKIFATNLQFDIFAIFQDTEYEKELKKCFRSSHLISIDFRGLKFLDTLNYSFFSVHQQGEFLGIDKLPYPPYIKERRKPKDDELEYVIQYNIQDCLITFMYALYIQDSFNKLGCELKNTIASSSMDLFRRKFLKENIKQPEKEIIDELKNAYYGGRTEVFKRGKIENIYYYDYNSCYPNAMLNNMPDPNYLKVSTRPPISILEFEGVSKCSISAPLYLDIPFLPKKHKGKLLFPLGKWEAYYTHLEIRKALSLGYKINLLKSFYYEKTLPFFKEFVEYLYPLRKEMKRKGDKTEYAVKILLNSLYGKFAQSCESEELKHIDEMTETDYNNIYYMLPDSDYCFVKKINEKYPIFVNPIFSIYVTAYARLKLYEDFEKIGFDNIYYCDTDSIFTKTLINSSVELGELKLEKFIKTGVLIKPKMYYIEHDNEIEVKIKGIKGKDYKTIEDILQSKSIKEDYFIKFKRAVRSQNKYKFGKLKVNEVIQIEKNIDLQDNKRKWESKFNHEVLQVSTPIYIS